ncbi:MAG TPA: DUF4199 domain-containing protein [Steroidobacteraceae bacterium]|jgi:hypothetical protein|nr:DUF4199 domain-containing protein [Steroidobacteraceae bacterium]
MKSVIVRHGSIAGLVIGIPMIVYSLSLPADASLPSNMTVITYAVMLVALSMVFVGIKQYRDKALGGVIKFGPALLLGLGISAVAGFIYAVSWEISMAFMKFDFSAFYAKVVMAQARAAGADEAKAAADAAHFTQMYANPLFRFPMTFLEIFPVGILVSLISAGLLQNSRFLPARAAPN